MSSIAEAAESKRKQEENLLPPICPDGNHRFAPGENTVTPTCGAFSGADVYMEAMVVSTTPKEDYVPQGGDVCSTCFQINGQPAGTRDPNLTRLYLDLASWS